MREKLEDELDRNLWLFNVQNGMIDALAGEFQEYRREVMNLNRTLEPKVRWAKVSLLITKLTNVVYDPQADCPLGKLRE
jgi:hypothetical protein